MTEEDKRAPRSAWVPWLVAGVAVAVACVLAVRLFAPGLAADVASFGALGSSKTAVRAKLKDPESARFGLVYLGPDRKYACGEVNAKNSMGGYVGMTRFMLQRSTGFVEFEPPAPEAHQAATERLEALQLQLKFVEGMQRYCGEPPQ